MKKVVIRLNELRIIHVHTCRNEKKKLLFICILMEHFPVTWSYQFLKHSSAFFLAFFLLRWFDVYNSTIQYSQCNFVSLSWSLCDVIHAGYWPGSPTDTSYVFDQQLFHLQDAFQKRMPGTSESSIIRALEDVPVIITVSNNDNDNNVFPDSIY